MVNKKKSEKKVKLVGRFSGSSQEDNDNFLKFLSEHEAYLARKKKRDIQRFREKCESLGFSFIPSEEKLVDLYLRSKNSGKDIDDYWPIEEAEVYGTHPKCLIENGLHTPGKVRYFFTCNRLNEIQSSSDGHWIFTEKGDVLSQGKKVGVKQVFKFWEGDYCTGYKIIEYQLDPAPVDSKVWFICKLLDNESCLVVPNEA